MNGNQAMRVLFIKGTSFISQIIRAITGDYSHCCLLLTNGTHIFESTMFTRSRIVFNPYLNKKYDVIEFQLADEQVIELNKLVIQFSGCGYDYNRAIGFGLQKLLKLRRPHFMNEKYNFLCSESVEIILGSLGLTPIDEKFGDKTPTELFLHLRKLQSNKREISLETEA